MAQGESFVFETVFSDPVGDKLEFLRRLVARYPRTLENLARAIREPARAACPRTRFRSIPHAWIVPASPSRRVRPPNGR